MMPSLGQPRSISKTIRPRTGIYTPRLDSFFSTFYAAIAHTSLGTRSKGVQKSNPLHPQIASHVVLVFSALTIYISQYYLLFAQMASQLFEESYEATPTIHDTESGYASGASSQDSLPDVYFSKPHLKFLNQQLQQLEPEGSFYSMHSLSSVRLTDPL